MGKKSVEGEHLSNNEIQRKGYFMKFDRVGATVGVTHNLGDFNSVRIDFSAEVNVADGDDPLVTLEQLYLALEAKVGEKLEEYSS